MSYIILNYLASYQKCRTRIICNATQDDISVGNSGGTIIAMLVAIATTTTFGAHDVAGRSGKRRAGSDSIRFGTNLSKPMNSISDPKSSQVGSSRPMKFLGRIGLTMSS